MRIAAIGGGGFRTPVVYEAVRDVARSHPVDELVLHDPSAERLARIADVIAGLREESGEAGPAVRTTTSLDEALEGAGFVFAAIRVGGLLGRLHDETVPLQQGVLGQETVGPGGIAFALRTVPAMERIAERVLALAPGAWFVNFTNPAGLVTEALVEQLGDRVVGVCDSPAALCARVAATLGRPAHSLTFDYAGINHLGWLLAVRDGGLDLLPALLEDPAQLRTIHEVGLVGLEYVRRLGAIPNEYLVYYEHADAVVAATRRSKSRAEHLMEQQAAFFAASPATPGETLAAWRRTRDRRHTTYLAEARDAAGAPSTPAAAVVATDEGPGEAGYANVAAWFVSSVLGGTERSLVLNQRNGGRIPALPADSVIEAPAMVRRDEVSPQPVSDLPAAAAELVARVKQVERLTIRAARERSASLALEAIAAHPLVHRREVAEAILGGYLRVEPELRSLLR